MPKAKNMLGHPRSYTNILPKLMTRVELMRGYQLLLERVYSWKSFSERICGFISVVSRPPKVQVVPISTQETARMIDNPGIGPDARPWIEKIIRSTMEKAPFMMQRVNELIIQHGKYLESVNKLIPQIDRQIDLESSGRVSFELDSRPIPVGLAFRDAYKDIFPAIYSRLYSNLQDKNRIPEALVEVFVDFLVRWGDGFKLFEAYHQEFFYEICDRTSAKFNGHGQQEFIPDNKVDLSMPDVKVNRLGDDILKSVEQELIKLSGPVGN
jgi:hypothetical protein